MNKRNSILFVVIIFTFGDYLLANIINVPLDQPAIQEGIDAASDADTVLVETGTYVENIDFNGKNIVVGSLFLTTGDTSYISQTVIDGNQNGSVVTFDNGEGPNAVLTGFTITNGLGQLPPNSTGGGITCKSNSNPTLTDLNINGNSTDSGPFVNPSGGGIFCENSSPSLVNVMISGNSASFGGAIFCENSSPNLVNVTISENSASSDGGIFCWFSSDMRIMNTILWNNSPQEIYFHEDFGANSIEISYSDVQGGKEGIVTNNNGTVFWLNGNIDADPLFCNPDSGDYTLAENSPCVGTGENGANMGALGGGCGTIPTAVENQNSIPTLFALHQNYPNPFNSGTTIQYELPRQTRVKLLIYNILGQQVAKLLNEDKEAGRHFVRWHGRDDQGILVGSGIYIYRMQAGDLVSMKKLTFLK